MNIALTLAAVLLLVSISSAFFAVMAEQEGKEMLFRDIANQRCAPNVALISADNPYRYVCVPKGSN